MSSSTIHLTDAAFDQLIQNADRPVLIDFHASWCPPCRVLGPTVDRLAEHVGDRAVVAKMDIDAEPETASRFDIRSIPTLLVFVGGEVVERRMGVQSFEELESMIDSAAAPSS